MKPALLLLHGALGSQEQFLALRDTLSDQFEVYMLDFSGHGTRSSENDFSIEQFVIDVEALVEKYKIETLYIFGYSMGGYVGLQYSRNHPEKVTRIITLGTKFNWTVETVNKEIKLLDPDVIEIKAPAFAETLRLRHGDQTWKDVLHKTKTMMINLGHGAALSAHDFKKIQCPVLVCLCDADNMVSKEESVEVAGLLPHGDFRLIEGCQHPWERVDTQSIATIIREMHFQN